MSMQNIGRKLDQKSLNRDQVNYAQSRTTFRSRKNLHSYRRDIHKISEKHPDRKLKEKNTHPRVYKKIMFVFPLRQ